MFLSLTKVVPSVFCVMGVAIGFLSLYPNASYSDSRSTSYTDSRSTSMSQFFLKDCSQGLLLYPTDLELVDPELRAMMPLLSGVGGDSSSERVPGQNESIEEGIAKSRERIKQLFAHRNNVPTPNDGVIKEERFIPGMGEDPPVRVLVYKQEMKGVDRPILLDIHGGAFVLGSADGGEAMNRMVAKQLDAIVVSVDFRLAPENPFPDGMNDNYAALQWLHRNAQDLGADPNNIIVSGGSSGGAMAASLALMARDSGEIPIKAQMLIYPSLDDRSFTELDLTCKADTAPAITSAYKLYIGDAAGTDKVSPYAFAARAENLEGLPPTFIAVGAVDGLVDQSIEYAQRLIWAGVQTELNVYPGAYHGFNIVTTAGVTERFNQDYIDALSRAWAR